MVAAFDSLNQFKISLYLAYLLVLKVWMKRVLLTSRNVCHTESIDGGDRYGVLVHCSTSKYQNA